MSVAGLALLLAGLMGAAPEGAGPCELHLYSYLRPSATSAAAMHSAFIRVLPPSDDPFDPSNLMLPANRYADLNDAEIIEALRLAPSTRIVRHVEESVLADAVKKRPTRLSTSTSACYAELVGYGGIEFPANRSPSGRNDLVVRFLYRSFDGPGPATMQLDKPGHVLFPKFDKNLPRDSDEARAILHQGSKDLLSDFGSKLAKLREKGDKS